MTFDPNKDYSLPTIDLTVKKDKIVLLNIGDRVGYAHLIENYDAPHSFGWMFGQIVLINGPVFPYEPGSVIKVDNAYYGMPDINLGLIRLAESYKFDKASTAICSGTMAPFNEPFNMLNGGYVVDDNGVFKNIANRAVTITDINENLMKSVGMPAQEIEKMKMAIGKPRIYSMDESGRFTGFVDYAEPLPCAPPPGSALPRLQVMYAIG